MSPQGLLPPISKENQDPAHVFRAPLDLWSLLPLRRLLLLLSLAPSEIGSPALSPTGLAFTHLRDWELAVPLPQTSFSPNI